MGARTLSFLFCAIFGLLVPIAPSQAETELVAGSLTASVKPISGDRTLPAGGTAFVEIIVTNIAAAKPVEVELVLYPYAGTVRAVTGPSVKVTDQASTRTVKIGRLAKDKPVTVLVEIALAQEGADGHQRLTINLHEAASRSGAGATLSWRVTDCAGDFHRSLSELGEKTIEPLKEAIVASRTADKALPGKWVFSPPPARKGAASPLPAEGPSEAQIASFASSLVGRRGLDLQLRQDQRLGWLAQRVATDLEAYLTQAPNAALCTGARGFTAYYRNSLDEFRKRQVHVTELAEAARLLAEARLETLADDLSTTGTVSTQGETRTKELGELVTQIAHLTGVDALTREVGETDGLLDALSAIRQSFGGAEALSAEFREATRPALAAIEAAFYLKAAQKRYDGVIELIEKGLEGIQKAHAEHCRCC